MAKATRGKQVITAGLERQLLAYSAVAGAVLAGAPAVEAQVDYTDIPDAVIGAAGMYELDLNNDGTPEFRLKHQTFRTGPYSSVGIKAINDGLGQVVDPITGYVSALTGADPISTGQPFQTGLNPWPAAVYNYWYLAAYNTRGPWPGTGEHYAGLRFTIGGATHYGWVRVNVPAGSTSFTVMDYAYEQTAGVGINAGALPVELVSFEGLTGRDGVSLRWATASETNNAGFEVQMRRAGASTGSAEAAFAPIGFVAGRGTTLEAQRYEYAAGVLAPGRYVFRLKQVDFDGRFAYSPEVALTVEVPGTHVLGAAYPNPFNPRTQFTLAVAQGQPVTVEVFDALGRRVALVHEGFLEGGQTHGFVFEAGAELPSGVYVVRAAGETFHESRTLTLAK